MIRSPWLLVPAALLASGCTDKVKVSEERAVAHAAEIARADGGGWMATILRKPGRTYAAAYDKVPLERVANSERSFPKAWLAPSRTDVTDDFVDYALPLIGQEWAPIPLENGLQRFARFQKIFADKKCGPYTPEGYA